MDEPSMDPYQEACAQLKDVLLQALSSTGDLSSLTLQAMQSAFPEAQLKLQDNDILKENFTEKDRTLVDDATLALIMDAVDLANTAQKPAMHFVHPQAAHSQPLVHQLFEQVQLLSDWGLSDVAQHTTVIEYAMETCTTSDASDIFAYMESKLPGWDSEKMPQSTRLNILRTCNNLIKRLSKANDVQLCGRILMFLTKFLPISEKSGLNMQGMYNTNLLVPIDDVQPGASDSSGDPIDPKLYSTFWGLQQFFQNPQQAITGNTWVRVYNDIHLVLDYFSRHKATVPATGVLRSVPRTSAGVKALTSAVAKGAASLVGDQGPMPMEEDTQSASNRSEDDAVGVRYLSNSQLFGLQLRDATFRRHFLVQCLILMHYVAYPDAKQRVQVKEKPPTAQLEELTNKLQQTPKHGKEFSEAVAAVLKRETFWVQWKAAGCKEFERKPIDEQPAKRRRLLRKAPAERTTVSRLVAVPKDQLQGLKMEERRQVQVVLNPRRPYEKEHLMPDLETFVQPVVEGLDPQNEIADSDKNYKQPAAAAYVWRAQRLISRQHMQAFAACPQDLEANVLMAFPHLTDKFGLELDKNHARSGKYIKQKGGKKDAAASVPAPTPPPDLEPGEAEVKQDEADLDPTEAKAEEGEL